MEPNVRKGIQEAQSSSFVECFNLEWKVRAGLTKQTLDNNYKCVYLQVWRAEKVFTKSWLVVNFFIWEGQHWG